MTITQHEIGKLLQRIKAKGYPLAVFIKDGCEPMTCKSNTDLFARSLEHARFYFLGVYDKRCQLDWLIDDFTYARKEMVK